MEFSSILVFMLLILSSAVDAAPTTPPSPTPPHARRPPAAPTTPAPPTTPAASVTPPPSTQSPPAAPTTPPSPPSPSPSLPPRSPPPAPATTPTAPATPVTPPPSTQSPPPPPRYLPSEAAKRLPAVTPPSPPTTITPASPPRHDSPPPAPATTPTAPATPPPSTQSPPPPSTTPNNSSHKAYNQSVDENHDKFRNIIKSHLKKKAGPQLLTKIFGIIGILVSVAVYMAPVVTFKAIYIAKSTGNYSVAPYIVALSSSTVWLYYGSLLPDGLQLMIINGFGCVVELVYIIIYIFYSALFRRIRTASFLVLCVGIVCTVIFSTHSRLTGDWRVYIVGWICFSASILVYTSTVGDVVQAIRTKDVKEMPITLTGVLTGNAIIWGSYGVFRGDSNIWVPNLVGFILGVVQILVYWRYHTPEAAKGERQPPAAAGEPQPPTAGELHLAVVGADQEIDDSGGALPEIV